MSNNIDDRIVRMQFDNQKFERGVSTSMRTLDKLKEKLSFKGAVDGLSNLQSSIADLTFAPIQSGLAAAGEKFTWLEVVAISAISRITNKVMDMGERLVSSVSIDQIAGGYTKYEQKTAGVQTILAATGKSIEEVNKSLSKLNWFTDETSYNFTDMINNIGKFTSAGVDLDVAVSAMEGISTWASVSGQGVNEASRAMYNLAQAIGVGSVKLMDWRSIENANMGTQEFKKTALETAVALGMLKKSADGTFTTLKGHSFTVESFNEQLKDEWFSKDVLLKTLNRYGEFADKVYEYQQEHDIDTAAEAMQILGEKTMSLGEKAFRAAQEAKSFTEAIDSVKDAVSTGWMNTFELIFGNYEEAKVLWTDLANELYDVFASGGEFRNAVLEAWNATEVLRDVDGKKYISKSGREHFIESIKSMYGTLKELVGQAREAFDQFFSVFSDEDKAVKALKSITNSLLNFSVWFKQLRNSTFILETFSMIFGILKGILEVTKTVFKVGVETLQKVSKLLSPATSKLRLLYRGLSNIVTVVSKNFGSGSFLYRFLTGIADKALERIVWLFDKIKSNMSAIKLPRWLTTMHRIITDLLMSASQFSIKDIFDSFMEETGLSEIVEDAEEVVNGVEKAAESVSEIKDDVITIAEMAMQVIRGTWGDDWETRIDKLQEAGYTLDSIAKARELVNKIWVNGKGFVPEYEKILDEYKEAAIKEQQELEKISENETDSADEEIKKIEARVEVVKLLAKAMTEIPKAINSIKKEYNKIKTDITTKIQEKLPSIIYGVTSLAGTLLDIGLKVIPKVYRIYKAFVGGIIEIGSFAFTKIFGWLLDTAPKVLDKLNEYFTSWDFGRLKLGIEAVGKSIKYVKDTYFSADSEKSLFGNLFSSIYELASTSVTKIFDWITFNLPTALAELSKWIRILADGIYEFFNKIDFSKIKDTIINTFGSVFGAISANSGNIITAIQTILSWVSNLLVMIVNYLPNAINFIGSVLTTIVSFIGSTFPVAIDILTKSIGKFKAVITSVIDKIKYFFRNRAFDMLYEPTEQLARGLNRHNRQTSKKSEIKRKYLEQTEEVTSVFDWLRNLYQNLGDSTNEFLKWIKQFFAGVNFDKVYSAILTIGSLVALVKISNAISTITKNSENLLKQLVIFKHGYNPKSIFESFSVKMIAIGTFLISIAGSIVLIGNMPIDAFIRGAVTTGAILGGLLLITGALSKFSAKSTKNVTKKASDSIKNFATVYFSMAISLALISASIITLGYIPEAKLQQGAKAVAIMMVVMAGIQVVMGWISPKKSNEHLGKAIMNIGIALALLTIPIAMMVVLQKIATPKQLAGSIATIVGIGVLMGVMQALLNYIPKNNGESAGKAFVSLAKALILLMIPIGILTVLAKIAPKAIWQALLVLAAVTAALTLVQILLNVVPKKNGESGAKAAKSLALALLILTVPIAILTAIAHGNTKAMIVAAATIAGIILVLGGAIAAIGYFGKNLKTGPIIAFSLIIGILSIALIALSSLNNWGNVIASAVSLGIAVLAVAASLSIAAKATAKLSDIAKFAVMAGVLIGAVALIGLALRTLEDVTVNWQGLAVVGVLILMVGAISLLGNIAVPAAVGIAIVIGALYLLVGVVALAGLALQSLAAGLRAMGWLKSGGNKTANNLKKNGKAYNNTTRDIRRSNKDLAKSYGEGAEAAANAADAYSEAAATMTDDYADYGDAMAGVQDLFSEFDMSMFGFGADSIKDFAVGIGQNIGLVDEQGNLIIGSFLSGIGKKIGLVDDEGNATIGSFLGGIAKSIGLVDEEGNNVVTNFIAGLSSNLTMEKLSDKGSEFVTNVITGVGKKLGLVDAEGVAVISGLFNGLTGETGTGIAEKGGESVIGNVFSGIKSWLTTPDAETGRNLIQNIVDSGKEALGISDLNASISGIGASIGKGIMDGIVAALADTLPGRIASVMKYTTDNFTGNVAWQWNYNNNMAAQLLSLQQNAFGDGQGIDVNIPLNILTTVTSDSGNESNVISTYILGIISALTEDESLKAQLEVGASSLTGTMKETFEKGVDDANSGKYFMDGLSIGIKDNTETVTNEVATAVQALLAKYDEETETHSPSGVMMQKGKYLDEGLALGIQSGIGSIRNAVSTITNKIKTMVNGLNLYAYGVNVGIGFGNGIQDSQVYVAARVSAMCNATVNTIRHIMQIHSPSRVMRGLGSYTGQGYAYGLSDSMQFIQNAAEDLGVTTIDTMSDTIATIYDILNGTIDIDPTIRPIVDMSNVTASAGVMNSIFGSRSLALAASTNATIKASNAMIESANAYPDNTPIVSELQNLRNDISALSSAVTNMRMVMDTGALVGSIVGPLDNQLGVRAIRKGRFN